MTPEIGQADVFISYAHEDQGVARPLAEALRQHGLTVWYDEYVLQLGDSLREVIERGLATAQFGIVILSPNFFAKEWPKRELNALLARETSKRSKFLLPVWHNLTVDQIVAHSPILADRLAASTASGLPFIVEQVLQVLESEKTRPAASLPPGSPITSGPASSKVTLPPENGANRNNHRGALRRLRSPAIVAILAASLIMAIVLLWRPWHSSVAPSPLVGKDEPIPPRLQPKAEQSQEKPRAESAQSVVGSAPVTGEERVRQKDGSSVAPSPLVGKDKPTQSRLQPKQELSQEKPHAEAAQSVVQSAPAQGEERVRQKDDSVLGYVPGGVEAIVRISGTRGDTTVRGSGFVVSLDRDKATIVTASHVIEGVQQIEVTFASDVTQSFPVGSVLGMDAGSPNGLAVFQVRGALPPGVTTMSFELENRPPLGKTLFLLGFPQMDLTPRRTQRVLAGRRGTLLLIDQEIGEGFSGGPVLQGGKVVGVITETDSQMTYAVNSVVAHEALESWGVKLGMRSSTSVPSATTQAKPPPPTMAKCGPGKELKEKGITYVLICGGTFIMGSAENDPRAKEVEKPAHQVTLAEFWIGKTEITNEQYRSFRPDHQGDARLPVTGISWTDAQAACAHFDGRLPTEAEWEYAARAREDEKILGEHAWYEKNSDERAHPVETRKGNAWSLHDMHGNVWEWVADWYGPYPKEAQTNPSGPTEGVLRVMRGGSFNDSPWTLRSTFRGRGEPTDRGGNIGFRCSRGSHRQS